MAGVILQNLYSAAVLAIICMLIFHKKKAEQGLSIIWQFIQKFYCFSLHLHQGYTSNQVQYPNHMSCSLFYKKVKLVTTYSYKWSAVVLQRCPELQITFSSHQGTCSVGADSSKYHIITIFIYFSVRMKTKIHQSHENQYLTLSK